MIRKLILTALAVLLVFQLQFRAQASSPPGAVEEGGAAAQFDMDEQFEALGRSELMETVPDDTRDLMEQAGVGELSSESMLELSPREFFSTIWSRFLVTLRAPMAALGAILGIVILSSLLQGMQNSVGEGNLSPVFSTVAVLCVLGAVAVPILNCIVETAEAIKQATTFMLSFIPMFSAALMAAGQPVTGTTYNLFLFSTCQGVAQVVATTLIPLMSIYLALCIISPVAPNLNISSATKTIKSLVSWALGLLVSIFVGLLSVQTMVASSADSVTTRTAKFLLGSFVPVVGSALSDAYTAAQGCLRLIKTSLGAYGIIVAVFTFLPILMQVLSWYALTNVAVIGSDVLGVSKVSEVLKACASVLGILIAIIFCYALLIVVSTTVVMVTGLGGT